MADIRILRRRNSTVRVYSKGDSLHVAKKYHRRYSIVDEANCYRLAESIVRGIRGLSVASVESLDLARNEIHLEYVPGQTLRSLLARDGISVLDKACRTAIVQLAVLSYGKKVSLDADPSNFIVSPDAGELIIVDPMIDVAGLHHPTMVVFMWGLMKYHIRYCFRFREWKLGMSLWSELMHSYAADVEVSVSAIYEDLARYSNIVIGWNVNESGFESIFMRLARLFFLVPLVRFLGFWFRMSGIAR